MANLQRGAEPFRFEGNQVGCLLLHGLTGSPYEQLWLGEYLHQQGYTVYGPRLAGHGTDAADLAQTTWRAWYDSAVHAYRVLRQDCDTILCSGLSMGALLTLLLAANEPLDGIILMAPAYEIKIAWQRWAIPIIGWAGGMWPKDTENEYTIRLRQEVRSEQQQRYGETYKAPGYDVWPLKAVYQMTGLMAHVRQKAQDVRCPTLFIHALDDPTAPSQHSERFSELISSKNKQTLNIPVGGHVLTQDVARYQVYEAVGSFIAAQLQLAESAQ